MVFNHTTNALKSHNPITHRDAQDDARGNLRGDADETLCPDRRKAAGRRAVLLRLRQRVRLGACARGALLPVIIAIDRLRHAYIRRVSSARQQPQPCTHVPFLVCGATADAGRPLTDPCSPLHPIWQARLCLGALPSLAAQAMIIPGEPTAAARLLQAQAPVLQ
jgi:hypothetical protein